MTTANDLIESAALKLGAKQTGESLTPDEVSDALGILNSMLDYWAIDNMMVFQIVQSVHSWTSGQATRTIGTGGDFNVTRPIRIEDGTYFRDGGVDVPVRIVRDRATYDNVSTKTSQSTYPSIMYYDPAMPLGVLNVYPVPSATIELHLNKWQVLQSFASLTDVLSLPPGYQWMIEHNLAVALEPVFSLAAPESVRAEAMKSRNMVKKFNHIPITSMNEASYLLGNGGRHDIYAGE